MSILIIETSTEESFVSLGEKTLWLEKQSTDLIPALQKLFLHSTPTEILIGIGPGSFTGTRIGTTTAKMLAYTLNLPIRAFPSLAAFTHPETHVVAVTAHSRGTYIYDGKTTILSSAAPKKIAISPHPQKLPFPALKTAPNPGHLLAIRKTFPYLDPQDIAATYL